MGFSCTRKLPKYPKIGMLDDSQSLNQLRFLSSTQFISCCFFSGNGQQLKVRVINYSITKQMMVMIVVTTYFWMRGSPKPYHKLNFSRSLVKRWDMAFAAYGIGFPWLSHGRCSAMLIYDIVDIVYNILQSTCI